MERRWHSSILDVRSFRGGDCNIITIWWLEELGKPGSKQKATQKFDVERFNLKKLSELEVRKEYQIKISKRSVALENVSDSQNINRAWENIRDNIKTRAKESIGEYELKRHKPCFDEEKIFRSNETG
jgi:hypothetical protein